MSDPEIATKAPENDAAEDAQDASTVETPAAHCVTDRPAPTGEIPTGEVTKLGNVDVYIAKPADYPHAPSKLLLYLTGGTGYTSVNNQLQADRFASEGFLVIVPDQFGGDLAAGNTITPVATADTSLLDKIKLGIADIGKSFMIDTWLARQTPEKVLPVLHKVIAAAKDEFADAVANADGIYGVGYCVGARFLLLLGGEHEQVPATFISTDDNDEQQPKPITSGPYIKAAAIAHAAQVAPDELAKLRVPTLLVCVDNDPLFPAEVRQAGVEALEAAQVEHEVKVYPQVPHGFAVVGEYADGQIRLAQQQAYAQMLGWLQAH